MSCVSQSLVTADVKCFVGTNNPGYVPVSCDAISSPAEVTAAVTQIDSQTTAALGAITEQTAEVIAELGVTYSGTDSARGPVTAILIIFISSFVGIILLLDAVRLYKWIKGECDRPKKSKRNNAKKTREATVISTVLEGEDSQGKMTFADPGFTSRETRANALFLERQAIKAQSQKNKEFGTSESELIICEGELEKKRAVQLEREERIRQTELRRQQDAEMKKCEWEPPFNVTLKPTVYEGVTEPKLTEREVKAKELFLERQDKKILNNVGLQEAERNLFMDNDNKFQD